MSGEIVDIIESMLNGSNQVVSFWDRKKWSFDRDTKRERRTTDLLELISKLRLAKSAEKTYISICPVKHLLERKTGPINHRRLPPYRQSEEDHHNPEA